MYDFRGCAANGSAVAIWAMSWEGVTTMGKVVEFWTMLKSDRRAVTALEYGLIAGVIVATIAVGFSLLANSLSAEFQSIGGSL
jgi:Flp pilus assembly pilin Flp